MKTLFENIVDDNGAVFSECGKYRYCLWRITDLSKPVVMCIGLNPSKATRNKNDNTITRLISLTGNLGYGGFYMMNLFSYITPYPKELKKAEDLNREADKWFTTITPKCKDVIFCWGGFEILSLYQKFYDRIDFMTEMFPEAYCFGYTKSGNPRHPLMLPKGTGITKFI